MSRPTRDYVNMKITRAVSMRSTCARRKVGCVLINDKGHVLSTGYNGVAAGLPHCLEGIPCKGANHESGKGLDECEALHAEQNALLQCKDVYEIDTCYTTTQPCIHCIKLLLNTSCKRIVYLDAYPHEHAERLWHDAGRALEQFQSNTQF